MAEGNKRDPSNNNVADESSLSTSCTVSLPSSSSLIPRILSGSIGSLATALAVTPLEVVKIRQQSAGAQHILSTSDLKVEPCPKGCGGTVLLNNGLMECLVPKSAVVSETASASMSSTRIFSGMFESTAPTRSLSIFHTLVSIFHNEGWAGLYAGLRPTLLMSVPNTVLYFTAYDEISMRLRQNHMTHISAKISVGDGGSHIPMTHDQCNEDAKGQAYIPLVAGSTSRLLASLATAPLELIRTRQASAVSNKNGQGMAGSGMIEEFRLLLRTNGISSLYVGIGPTLWRDVPFSALYWLCLERFRNSLSDTNELGSWGGQYYRDRGSEIPPSVEAMHAFVSGAAAGAIAAALTTPFDVVKTRRQMVGGQVELIQLPTCDNHGCGTDSKSAIGYSRINNMGTFGHMKQIIHQEGAAGLWKGNATRMVKVAPACAIMISCYEFGKRIFGDVL